jgi:glutamate formiminotransferase / 5-formyltetrahydrofolate cyclo-ligase
MKVVAVPNVSEGRVESRIGMLVDATEAAGARVLDLHSDPVHNRSVLTVAGATGAIVTAMADLASAARYIDLTQHEGAHPRLGGLDVCPIVAHGITVAEAVSIARSTGRAVAARARLPVYLYGAAATSAANRDLPALRSGGLKGLIERCEAGLAPDFGPPSIDPRTGVVCVGARHILIAFNVWLGCDEPTARSIARVVRTSGGAPPALRAIGLAMRPGFSQVSINLMDPDLTGIDAAFDAVAQEALRRRARVVATELVGLVPERFQPDPSKHAARLLLKPGRTLESALRS